MASIKISELNELTSVDDSDFLPIVDSSANETKKITYENLRRIITITGTTTRLAGQTTSDDTINLPAGYTFDNCRILNYNYTATANLNRTTSSAMSVSMINNNTIYMTLTGNADTSDITFNYEIVLIKIS